VHVCACVGACACMCVCVRTWVCSGFLRYIVSHSGFLRYIVSDSGFLRLGILHSGLLRMGKLCSTEIVLGAFLSCCQHSKRQNLIPNFFLFHFLKVYLEWLLLGFF
jgi:hypothetical protein